MRFLIYIILIFIVLSCDKNGFLDAGNTVTREINIPEPFNLIEAENIFDITLVQDTICKIRVTCGENLQKFVDVKVDNNTLHLNHHTKYDWSRPYEKIKLEFHLIFMPPMNIREPIHLTSKGILSIPSFYIVDWGKFSEVNVSLDVDNCSVYMSSDNFGYFIVRGKCKTANLWGWGSCIVRADSLIAENCSVLQRGWGDVYVNFTQRLRVSIESSGTIYYKGNPMNIIIDKQVSNGKLIPLNP